MASKRTHARPPRRVWLLMSTDLLLGLAEPLRFRVFLTRKEAEMERRRAIKQDGIDDLVVAGPYVLTKETRERPWPRWLTQGVADAC